MEIKIKTEQTISYRWNAEISDIHKNQTVTDIVDDVEYGGKIGKWNGLYVGQYSGGGDFWFVAADQVFFSRRYSAAQNQTEEE